MIGHTVHHANRRLKERLRGPRAAIPDDVTAVMQATNAVDARSHDRELVIRRLLTCVSACVRGALCTKSTLPHNDKARR
jgi:hypothetical protein